MLLSLFNKYNIKIDSKTMKHKIHKDHQEPTNKAVRKIGTKQESIKIFFAYKLIILPYLVVVSL